jgi:hypothetical protein
MLDEVAGLRYQHLLDGAGMADEEDAVWAEAQRSHVAVGPGRAGEEVEAVAAEVGQVAAQG